MNYYVEGAKPSKAMQADIAKEINKKFLFPNFNMLLYAQEYLIKYASDPETRDENRNDIYDLYDEAH